MFLKVVFAILATIGAVVVLAIIAIVVLYILLARRIRARVRQSLQEFQSMQQATLDAEGVRRWDDGDDWDDDSEYYVPPMRIHLRREQESIFVGDSQIDEISAWIRSQGFDLLGDFSIDEIPDSALRVFIGHNNLLVAAIRLEDPSETPYVEFCFDLGGGRRGGVSNPPATTIALSEEAVGEHFDIDLDDGLEVLPKMLERAKQLCAAHSAIPINRKEIVQFFEQTHAAEMDHHIARGGLSEDEIAQVLGRNGDSVAPEDIEEVQWSWQDAIEDFLLQQSKKAIGAIKEDETVIAVSDVISPEYIFERLQNFYLDELDSNDLSSELDDLLERFKPREALARFRPLLPENLRFKKIDQLLKPVEADLYLMPRFE